MDTPTKEEVRAVLNIFSDYGDAFERTLERWDMTREQFDDLAAQYGLTLTLEDVLQDIRTIQRVRREVEQHTMQQPKKEGILRRLFQRKP
ncbi:MAG: hypothetical protein HC828_03390 [Blastochloris sp.]|nr:hypothetical protein [Blastochloris sp.]